MSRAQTHLFATLERAASFRARLGHIQVVGHIEHRCNLRSALRGLQQQAPRQSAQIEELDIRIVDMLEPGQHVDRITQLSRLDHERRQREARLERRDVRRLQRIGRIQLAPEGMRARQTVARIDVALLTEADRGERLQDLGVGRVERERELQVLLAALLGAVLKAAF